MRIAYLITAHGQYGQLRRLIAALDDQRVHFYIHVDAKSPMPTNLADFERVTFIERRNVWWAGWSQTRAILDLAHAAIADAEYDYYALISGADYPILPNQALFRTLEGGGEFISMVPQHMRDVRGGSRRTAYYYFDGFDRRRRTLRYLIMRSVERLLALLLRKRHPPLDLYVGSSWWVLSQDCMRYVLERAADGRIVRFFRTALSSDEVMIHSIVAASPFAANLRENLTYADWSEHKSGPALITPAHLPAMAASGKFFARKFDDRSASLVEQIDKTLRSA